MGKIGNISMPGITAERDLRGNIKSLNINVKKCDESVRRFFESFGISFEKAAKDEPKPNAKTAAAIRASRNTRGIKAYESVDELVKALDDGI